MREISADSITAVIRDLCLDANYNLGADVLDALWNAIEKEASPVGKQVLKELIENTEISKKEHIPLCQDCGTAVIFIELGQEVLVTRGNLRDAVNEGVRQGYKDGFLRKSLCNPITRQNTGDNTPAVIYYDIIPGDKIRIIVAPKGGGSENMSRVTMLTPAEGINGVKNFVINGIKEAGANPCPPTIAGIGIGGTFERSALLAKKALLRKIGTRNPDPALANIESEILEAVNKLGIGPMGYGGNITSLDVFLEMEPCHIASLPVAVNINCHSARHKEAII